MTKVFLSPSSQTANLVHGGGHEQQYARARCDRAAEVLRAHGVTVKVSSIMNDSAGGYFRSVAEGNAWGPDLYVADHTNATGLANSKARGVHNYCWLPDPKSVALGRALGARMDKIIGGTHQIRDGSHLYEVNGPHATAVLLENGFHDNAQDAAIIRTKTREMGEAIAYGILDYLGIPIRGANTPTPTPTTRRLIMPDQTIRDFQGKPITVEQILARIDAHVRPITRGKQSSELRQEVADTKNIATATQAQVTALTAAIGALSKSQGVDPALVERAIREAIADALDGFELSGEIKIGGTE